MAEIKPEDCVITEILPQKLPHKKCKMCGECCKYLAIDMPNINKQDPKIKEHYTKKGLLLLTIPGLSNDRLRKEYYKTRNIKVEGDKIQIPNLIKSWWEDERLIIKNICPHLKDKKCDIWGKHPILCKKYRGQKGYYIPKECVFK